MEREFRLTVVETKSNGESRIGEIIATHQRHREVGTRNPQHVLGEMLGDVIVSMAADDAANVLQALIARLDVLCEDALCPFAILGGHWRAWQVRGNGVAFSEFVKIEEATE